jgi:hypothetical protein
MELTKEERARLARELIASLDGPDRADAEARWVEELRERVRQAEAGEVEFDDWDDVRARVRTELSKNSE